MKDTSLQAAPAPALAATDAQRPTTVRWRIFLILLLLAAINYIDRASLSVALPLISAEFELTPAMEGLILSAFFWSYALMQIPSGMLLDRFQVRNIIGAATIGWDVGGGTSMCGPNRRRKCGCPDNGGSCTACEATKS